MMDDDDNNRNRTCFNCLGIERGMRQSFLYLSFLLLLILSEDCLLVVNFDGGFALNLRPLASERLDKTSVETLISSLLPLAVQRDRLGTTCD